MIPENQGYVRLPFRVNSIVGNQPMPMKRIPITSFHAIPTYSQLFPEVGFAGNKKLK